MIRVLHLLDADAAYQVQRGALHLSRDLGGDFVARVRTVGPGGDYRNAAVALAQLRREARAGFDVCHAWGARALTLAALAGGNGPLVYSPSAFPPARSLRWLRGGWA